MIDNIDRYESQYRFEMDLYIRFALAYDGHLRYTPTMLFGILGFGRPWTLVSVSRDGIEQPRVYNYDELVESVISRHRLPEHIIGIDGNDARINLEQTAKWAVSNDLDAAYNQVFFSLAQAALTYMGNGAGLWTGGSRTQALYQGDQSGLEWANGSILEADNYARVFVSFENITTGQDLYDRYIATRPPFVVDQLEVADGSSEPDVAYSEDLSGPPGYPKPVKILGGWAMGGYYIEDAAVLSLQSFGASYQAETLRNGVTDFLKQAKADAKTRLIIDLSANGGGHVPQA